MAEKDTELLDTDKNGADSDKDKKPVQLTPEQQEHVNTIFNSRFAKITAKFEEQINAQKAELETFKATKDADKEKDKDKDKDDDGIKKEFKGLLEAERNKTKLAEVERQKSVQEAKEAREEAMKVRKEVAIARAATKQNFYELDVVSNMIWDKVEFDADSNTFVVKEGGVIKQNSSMVPMTLEEYLTDFASKRPYLVNGDVKGGSNSTDNKSNNSAGLIKTRADLKTAKEKSDFITKFGLAKYEALSPGIVSK